MVAVLVANGTVRFPACTEYLLREPRVSRQRLLVFEILGLKRSPMTLGFRG